MDKRFQYIDKKVRKAVRDLRTNPKYDFPTKAEYFNAPDGKITETPFETPQETAEAAQKLVLIQLDYAESKITEAEIKLPYKAFVKCYERESPKPLKFS